MATKELAQPSEEEKIDGWRRSQFRKLLPEEIGNEEVEALVESSASPHDLDDLLKKECRPDLAVKILK